MLWQERGGLFPHPKKQTQTSKHSREQRPTGDYFLPLAFAVFVAFFAGAFFAEALQNFT